MLVTRIRLRRSGAFLYVVGRAPEKAGDRFEATASPPSTDADGTASRGCTLVSLPGGGGAFSCSRGPRRGSLSAPVKDYVFNPELHEVLQ
jgi:hypothetical protein